VRGRRELVVREVASADDDSAAAELMAEYLDWATERLRSDYGLEEAPAKAAEVAAKLAEYKPPHGVTLLAEVAGIPIGVGAIRWLSDGVAEIKRMYVQPSARGQHVGSSMLDALISRAVQSGAAVLRLDTVRFMTDAQVLYRSRGFQERPPYEGTEIPKHLQDYWIFFERPGSPSHRP
jgi:GNAT superfamily N-acetyltransferase